MILLQNLTVFYRHIFATLFLLGLSLLPLTAHADFRKALEAYLNRDGQVMLREVKSAIDHKKYDGLLLFSDAISLDELNSTKYPVNTSLSEEKYKVDGTLETIVAPSQRTELSQLLDEAMSTTTPEAQYNFYFKRLSNFTSQRSDKNDVIEKLESLANGGSSSAATELVQIYGSSAIASPSVARHWFIKAAEMGDPYSSTSLAFSYLGYRSKYFLSTTNCEQLKINGSCFERNLNKVDYWLKKPSETLIRIKLICVVSH